MKIGFDIDGVLANFIKAYQLLVVEMSGEDRFGPDDINNPPCWNWPEYRGYGTELMDFTTGAVWTRIKADPTFWRNLEPTAAFYVLRDVYPWLREQHDVTFITDRPGTHTKRQTEDWFTINGIWNPTVIVTGDKAGAAKLLKLDAYIDDRFENAVSVATQSPTTQSYLLDRTYNRLNLVDVYGELWDTKQQPTRIDSVTKFLAWLNLPTSV